MSRGKACPTCGNIPVSGKTWSLLTAQDELIARLRKERDDAITRSERLAERLKLRLREAELDHRNHGCCCSPSEDIACNNMKAIQEDRAALNYGKKT